MTIINGKRRYIREEDQQRGAPQEARLTAHGPIEGPPPGIQAPKPDTKKRYLPRAEVQEEKAPRVIKRHRRGEKAAGASVVKAVNGHDPGDYVGGYEFSVQFSLGSVSFSRISNIGGEIEVNAFVEGGNNRYPIVYQTPRRRPDVIVFEKGLTNSTAANLIISQLKEGTKVSNILIFVKKNKSLVKTFSISEGIILSRRYSPLDANSSSLIIERLEIAHSGVSEV